MSKLSEAGKISKAGWTGLKDEQDFYKLETMNSIYPKIKQILMLTIKELI